MKAETASSTTAPGSSAAPFGAFSFMSPGAGSPSADGLSSMRETVANVVDGNYSDPNHVAGFRMLRLGDSYGGGAVPGNSWAAIVVGNDNAKGERPRGSHACLLPALCTLHVALVLGCASLGSRICRLWVCTCT
jgi:hypothetical protein